MVRTRIFLALAFLAATVVATAIIPDAGDAAPSGCGDVVCGDRAGGADCATCKGDSKRSDTAEATACAAMCAATMGVMPTPAQAVPEILHVVDEAARQAPGGVPIAPERAPPRPSIHA